MLRNRIKRHVRVRAGDLVPHELNPRVHSEMQQRALKALYQQIGFARSLLAYELADGRLKLIDGHLRAKLDPEEIVEVEVLDVSDAEARTLLLAIDPLAQLAEYEATTLAELRSLVEPGSAAVQQIWQTISLATDSVKKEVAKSRDRNHSASLSEQYLVLVECQSEEQQSLLLRRLQAEGLTCRALIS